MLHLNETFGYIINQLNGFNIGFFNILQFFYWFFYIIYILTPTLTKTVHVVVV